MASVIVGNASSAANNVAIAVFMPIVENVYILTHFFSPIYGIPGNLVSVKIKTITKIRILRIPITTERIKFLE